MERQKQLPGLQQLQKHYAAFQQKFHQYIYHTSTILRSDHSPLKGFLKRQNIKMKGVIHGLYM